MGNYIFHCFKKAHNQSKIELHDFDIIDEVDNFSICIESDVELTDFTVLITDIPIGISVIGFINYKFWYQLNIADIKKYFEAEHQFNESVIVNDNSSKIFENIPELIFNAVSLERCRATICRRW